MKNDRVNTGVKPILKSLSAGEKGKEWELIRFVVVHAGWFLMLFVWGVYLLSPELRARRLWIYGWLSVYLAYQVVLEALSRAKKMFYNTPGFRMARIQIMAFLESVLLLLTGGAESYFWFVYLLPLFASALYFETWAVTWGVYGEIAALYFLVSWMATGSVVSINFALWLVNLAVLLLLSAVLRYLMESIRAYQATEVKLKYSEILQQIQQDIDTAIDVQEVLDRILRRAVELVGARDGSLMLMDEKGELSFRARLGRSLPEGKVERTFKPGEGVAGWVVQNRRPYICHDTKTDAHFIPIIAGMPIRSLISVPIISHGTVLGVINVDSTEPNRFSGADAELLVTLANQTAVAIERAELLDSLRQISEKTLGGAEDLDEHVVDAVHRLTRCPVAMWRVDEKTRTQATICAHRGLREEYTRERVLDLPHSVRGEAIRTAELIEVVDIQEDPRVSPESKVEARQQGWESMLVVPLLAGPGRAVGTLSICSLGKKRFTPWETDLLRTLASQAGVAMQNAERLQTIRQLGEVGRSLTVVRDLESLLQKIAESADSVLGADIIVLYEYQEAMDDVKVPPVVWGDIRYPEVLRERGRVHKESLVFKMLERTEPFYASNAGEDWTRLIEEWPQEEGKSGSFVHREGIASSAAVTLIADEERVGVLFVNYRSACVFDDERQKTIELFATQAAIAIRNARLHADLERQIERLQTLNQVSRELSAKLDKESIFEAVVKAIVRTLNCTHCTFFVLENNSLVPCASHSKGREAKVTRRFALGEGLAGWVAQTGKAILARDAKKLKRFSQGKTRPEVDRSMIVVPVKVDDQVVGVISVDQDRLNAFSEEDQRLAEALAAQAAVAFLTAELYAEAQAGLQERVDDIQALQDIYVLMGTASLNDMLQRIAKHAARLTPAKYTEVWLLDEQARELRFGARNEIEGETTRSLPALSLGETSINARVALTRETYLCNDIQGDPYYKAWYEDTRSELATPLIYSGKVIGTLNLESTEVGVFTDDHVRLVEALAGAAAVAIQSARSYETIRTLNEIGQALTSGIRLRKDEVLELIHRQASKLTNTDNMYIALYDEATDTVRFGLAFMDGRCVDVDNEKGWQPRRASTGKGRTEEIIRTKKPILTATKAEAEYWYKMPEHKEYVERTFASWLGVPMIVGDKVLGVIATYHPTWNYMYSRDDLELLQAIANQAAIALDNAALYGQNSRRVEQLNTVREITNTVPTYAELPDFLHALLDLSLPHLGTQSGTIQLFDEATNELVVEATTGSMTGKKFARIPLGQGITGLAVRERRVIYVPDVEESKDYLPYLKDTRSEMAAPLVVGDDFIGVFNLEDPRVDAFDQDTQELFELIAEQAAIAIHQTIRLIKEQNRRIEAERDALLGRFTQDIAHYVKNQIGIVRLTVINLLNDPELSESPVRRKELELIKRNAEMTIKLAQDLFEPYKQTEKEWVNVNWLIDEAFHLVGEQEDIKTYLDLALELPQVYIERQSMVGVFQELLINAHKAVRRGKEPRWIRVSSQHSADGDIELLFSNSGPPILQERWEVVFEQFSGTEEDIVGQEGFGLGLWSARVFLRRQGGDIRVLESNSTQTTFMVRLPVPLIREEGQAR